MCIRDRSKGNAVDPFEALQEYGADAIRWYFYSSSAPWLPSRFHGKAVIEGQRKFMGTLWNTYAFFVLYANIDNFDASKYTLEFDKLSVLDKWLLSRLNTLITEVDTRLDNYQIPEAARALQDFVDECSNWYVRRSRERFWAKGMEQDKINAYMTLYTALVTVSKLAAPMIPFMTEEIYQNLVRSLDKSAPESVHLCLSLIHIYTLDVLVAMRLWWLIIFRIAVSISCASIIGAMTLIIGSLGNMMLPSGIA